MLNIEHLKRQAKRYLRWHREQYYPVAAQIRWLLPRYRDLSDGEILALDFRLSDAQELVARRMGFESWEALRRGSHFASHQRQASTMTLLNAEPMLFVQNILTSCEFFSKMLGFGIAFTYGDPPFYAQVVRDGARLNLRHVDNPVVDPIRRETEQLLAAAITLEDAKPLFLEYQAAGVPFAQSLRLEPWGATTFIVRDPDGNLVLFAGRGE